MIIKETWKSILKENNEEISNKEFELWIKDILYVNHKDNNVM